MRKSIPKRKNLRSDNEAYERFLRGLALISIGLKGCSASLDRTRLHELYSDKGNGIKRTFTDTYKVTEVGEGYFEAAGAFGVTIQSRTAAPPPLSVNCEFEAHLHATKPIPKDFVERFVKSE